MGKKGKVGYREKDEPQKFTALEIDEWQIPSAVAKFSLFSCWIWERIIVRGYFCRRRRACLFVQAAGLA